MRKLIMVLLSASLFACSFGSTIYNNFDYVVLWKVADFVDLDNSQRQQVTNESDLFIAWHRKNELPKYHMFLEQLLIDLTEQTLTADKVNSYRFTSFQLRQNTLDNLQTRLPNLLATLTTQQYDEILENIEQQKTRKSKKTDADRLEDAFENIEDWYGSVNAEQKTFITKIHYERAPKREEWRKARQIWLEKITNAIVKEDINKAENVNNAIWSVFQPFSQDDNENLTLLNIWLLSDAKQKTHLIQKIQDIQGMIEKNLKS